MLRAAGRTRLMVDGVTVDVSGPGVVPEEPGCVASNDASSFIVTSGVKE